MWGTLHTHRVTLKCRNNEQRRNKNRFVCNQKQIIYCFEHQSHSAIPLCQFNWPFVKRDLSQRTRRRRHHQFVYKSQWSFWFHSSLNSLLNVMCLLVFAHNEWKRIIWWEGCISTWVKCLRIILMYVGFFKLMFCLCLNSCIFFLPCF